MKRVDIPADSTDDVCMNNEPNFVPPFARVDLTSDERTRADQCARAYRADNHIAYVNALGVLCVVCDVDNDDTRDGFMCVDGIWVEFDPVAEEVL